GAAGAAVGPAHAARGGQGLAVVVGLGLGSAGGARAGRASVGRAPERHVALGLRLVERRGVGVVREDVALALARGGDGARLVAELALRDREERGVWRDEVVGERELH